MSYETVIWEVDDGVGRVTLNRPERLNAWNEQFGLAYVEAMASGLAVVTTICGTNHEAVPDPNLRVPDDAGALAEAAGREPLAHVKLSRQPDDTSAEQLPQLGHYQILEVLGQGGVTPVLYDRWVKEWR